MPERAAQTCKTCDVNQDAPGGNPTRNSGANIYEETPLRRPLMKPSWDSQKNNSKEGPNVESTIVIQRFQQILSGSLQYSCKGRFTFSLGNLWVFLGSFEGIFPHFFFPSLLGRASHREPATEIVRWGVGWRRRALVREGNSPLDPGVTPRSIQSGSHLDPRGAL